MNEWGGICVLGVSAWTWFYCFRMMAVTLSNLISLRTLVLQVLLIIVCVVGDQLIKTEITWKRVMFDTLTHGLIGVLSWSVISCVLYEKPVLLAALLCGLLAMALDVDHFIAARSIHLKNALNLRSRPFLHSTSTIIVISLNVWVIVKFLHSCWNVSRFDYLPWMCLVAWLSHHARDAHRHGLWFMPFGSTVPLPQWMYIGLINILIWLVTMILYLRSAVNTVSITYLGGTNLNVGDKHIIEL